MGADKYLKVIYGFKTKYNEYIPKDSQDKYINGDNELLFIEDYISGQHEYFGIPIYSGDARWDDDCGTSVIQQDLTEFHNNLYNALAKHNIKVPYSLKPKLHIFIHSC